MVCCTGRHGQLHTSLLVEGWISLPAKCYKINATVLLYSPANSNRRLCKNGSGPTVPCNRPQKLKSASCSTSTVGLEVFDCVLCARYYRQPQNVTQKRLVPGPSRNGAGIGP